jgi:ribosome-associated translation inhibitor RaiA
MQAKPETEIKIEGRNFTPGRQLEGLINRKMEQLLRHLPAVDEARVEIIHEPTQGRQERYLAKMSVNIKGTVIRAERRGPSARSATHSAGGALDKLAARFKGRVYRSQRTRDHISLGQLQADETFRLDRELAQELLPDDAAVLSR